MVCGDVMCKVDCCFYQLKILTNMRLMYFLLFAIILQSCNKDDGFIDEPINEHNLYFPPVDSKDWDSKTLKSLNWNVSATSDLYDFLSQNGTRGFILLSEGKIVIEKYWGNNILNNTPFDKNSNWYWASAGKTLKIKVSLAGKGWVQVIIKIALIRSQFVTGVFMYF